MAQRGDYGSMGGGGRAPPRFGSAGAGGAASASAAALSTVDDNIARVFIGNIPFDATEQQLVEMFSAVGKIVNLRLQYDKDTGKPLGFGFCEFADPAAAKSAIRNLDGAEFHGRPLRVAVADTEKRKGSGQEERAKSVIQASVDAIAKVVHEMSQPQRIEVLLQMKNLVQTQPQQARHLLQQYPQLAHALVQLEASFNLIHRDEYAQLAQLSSGVAPHPPVGGQLPLDAMTASAAPFGVPPSHVPPPMHMLPPQQQGLQPHPHLPPFVAPPVPPPMPHLAGVAGVPPPMLPPQMPQAVAKALSALPPDQQAIMQRVLALSPAELVQQPPQIQELARQFLLVVQAQSR